MISKQCSICKKDMSPSSVRLNKKTCRRAACVTAYSEELEFWELTPVQKDHYSTFLSLIRTVHKPYTPKVALKMRNCMRCGVTRTAQHLCSHCNHINSRQSPIASLMP